MAHFIMSNDARVCKVLHTLPGHSIDRLADILGQFLETGRQGVIS